MAFVFPALYLLLECDLSSTRTYLLNLSWLVELASDRIPLTCDSIDYMCPVQKWIQKAWQGR